MFATGRIVVAALMLSAPAAQAQSSAGIDLHIGVSGLTEDYASTGPMTYAASRARVGYSIAANGTGVLASRRIGTGPQARDDSFAPGQEPRGFTVSRARDGRPVLRIWAQELQGDSTVPAKFVRGDWNAMAAGRPVTLVASARELQRAYGVTRRIGQEATQWLRGQFSDAIPFVTITIGALKLTAMNLSSDDVVIEGNGRRFSISYPDGDLSYSAPVSIGR